MSRKIYIIIGVVIMLVLLGGLGIKIYNKIQTFQREREWYAQQLNYDFSSTIDSIVFEEGTQGSAKLSCKLNRGSIDPVVEDSLARRLKHFDKISFNDSREPGVVRFVMPDAERFAIGDNVVVNSTADELKVFRNGEIIFEEKVSELLEITMTANFGGN